MHEGPQPTDTINLIIIAILNGEINASWTNEKNSLILSNILSLLFINSRCHFLLD